MNILLGRPGLCVWLSLWAVACTTGPRGGRVRATDPGAVRAPSAPQADTLYSPDEALRDALSGPLSYVGTGQWPGIRRMYACAFRNERVFVVNAYCSRSEQQALRLDVYSPTRGRVRIYAESKGAVSAHGRADYFTFMIESEPVASSAAALPRLTLAMSFEELRGYEDTRYGAFLPACYGGQELSAARAGCLGTLAPHATEWTSRNQAFFERASDDWYRAVRELRALAVQYGRDPD